MKQGEVGEDFFLIARGRCQVLLTTDEKKEAPIAELQAGDYCGEQALLHSATRGATVRAITNVDALKLDRDTFKKFTESSGIQFAKKRC